MRWRYVGVPLAPPRGREIDGEIESDVWRKIREEDDKAYYKARDKVYCK